MKSIPGSLVWRHRGENAAVLFAKSIPLADMCLMAAVCDFSLFKLVSCVRLEGRKLKYLFPLVMLKLIVFITSREEYKP